MDAEHLQSTGEIVAIDAQRIPGDPGRAPTETCHGEHKAGEHAAVIECVGSVGDQGAPVHSRTRRGQLAQNRHGVADQCRRIGVSDDSGDPAGHSKPVPGGVELEPAADGCGKILNPAFEYTADLLNESLVSVFGSDLVANLRRRAWATTTPGRKGVRRGQRSRSVRAARSTIRRCPALRWVPPSSSDRRCPLDGPGGRRHDQPPGREIGVAASVSCRRQGVPQPAEFGGQQRIHVCVDGRDRARVSGLARPAGTGSGRRRRRVARCRW
jgi:hypothetical protein